MLNNNDNTQAIGVLDSGLGGISILTSIWDILPLENTIYLADSAYAPYGNKQIDFIKTRTLNLCQYLLEKNVKAIVIACNTATTISIDYIRQNIKNIPIIGVEPGAKPALKLTQTNKVGILATENTLNSNNFKKLLNDLHIENPHIKFITQAGYGLVECIEQYTIDINNIELVNLCKKYIDNMLKKNVDTIVLGCTHYPFLLKILHNLYTNINFIETSSAVVSNLKTKLEQENTLNTCKNILSTTTHSLYSSLYANHVQKFMQNNCLQQIANKNIIYKSFEI